MSHFQIRNDYFGPIPPCNLQVSPLTVFTGGDRAGMGLLLRGFFFLSNLSRLMRILWDRDPTPVTLEESPTVRALMATAAFQALMEGQHFHKIHPGCVLSWKDREIVCGNPITLRSKFGDDPPCLFFPKERIALGEVKSPVGRASLSLAMEVLQGKTSQRLLRSPEPQIRLVELPELILSPAEQVEEAELLASWVNHGHAVVLGTNSTSFIQAIHNFILASELPAREIRGLPPVRCRLRPDQVSIYQLQADEAPVRIPWDHHRELKTQRERIELWVQTLRAQVSTSER